MKPIARIFQQRLALLFSIILLSSIISSILSPSYRALENITSILEQLVPLSFVAVGQMCALIIGSVDLSVGSLMSFITALGAKFIAAQSTPLDCLLWIVICLFFSVICGVLNGVLVYFLEVSPLVITLSTGLVVQGITFLLIQRPTGFFPRRLFEFLAGYLYFFPVSMIYLFFVALFISFVLYHTKTGRHMFAVGNNRRAAKIVGINVQSVTIKAHVMTSVLSGAGGIFLAIRLSSGHPTAGSPYTLDSVIAALLGGATFAGGQGSVINTILASLLFIVLSNSLKMLQVTPFAQYIIKGALFLFAVLFYNVNKKGRV